jgi:hypothetical protein
MRNSSKMSFLQPLLVLFVISFCVGFAFAADAGKEPAAANTTATAKATPLPADGGAPGKAYMEYCKAIQAGNMDSLRKLVSADRAKQMDDPEFKKMFPMIQSMQAKDIKITGGTMSGNTATLNATGKDTMGGGVTTGTIDMVMEDNLWKVKQDSWKSKMN